MKRRTFLQGMLGLGIAGTASLFSNTAQANELKVGKTAPPLVLHTIDGKSIDTRSLIGQVVIATFWATWCSPCRDELPLLSAYAKQHEAQGLRVLGFSLNSPHELQDVKEVAANLSFPVGLLGSPWVGEYGRIWHIPVSFVIDRKGQLVDNGWDDDEPAWTTERLHKIVDPLLAN